MTNEAIKILKEERDWAQQLSYVNKALDAAIEALEKQIPTKPRQIMEKGAFKVGFECGNCGTTFGYVSKRFTKCCPFCGQALDWSEEE